MPTCCQFFLSRENLKKQTKKPKQLCPLIDHCFINCFANLKKGRLYYHFQAQFLKSDFLCFIRKLIVSSSLSSLLKFYCWPEENNLGGFWGELNGHSKVCLWWYLKFKSCEVILPKVIVAYASHSNELWSKAKVTSYKHRKTVLLFWLIRKLTFFHICLFCKFYR